MHAVKEENATSKLWQRVMAKRARPTSKWWIEL
jgi:hypothetical protein